jgi:hypothetical protein
VSFVNGSIGIGPGIKLLRDFAFLGWKNKLVAVVGGAYVQVFLLKDAAKTVAVEASLLGEGREEVAVAIFLAVGEGTVAVVIFPTAGVGTVNPDDVEVPY